MLGITKVIGNKRIVGEACKRTLAAESTTMSDLNTLHQLASEITAFKTEKVDQFKLLIETELQRRIDAMPTAAAAPAARAIPSESISILAGPNIAQIFGKTQAQINLVHNGPLSDRLVGLKNTLAEVTDATPESIKPEISNAINKLVINIINKFKNDTTSDLVGTITEFKKFETLCLEHPTLAASLETAKSEIKSKISTPTIQTKFFEASTDGIRSFTNKFEEIISNVSADSPKLRELAEHALNGLKTQVGMRVDSFLSPISTDSLSAKQKADYVRNMIPFLKSDKAGLIKHQVSENLRSRLEKPEKTPADITQIAHYMRMQTDSETVINLSGQPPETIRAHLETLSNSKLSDIANELAKETHHSFSIVRQQANILLTATLSLIQEKVDAVISGAVASPFESIETLELLKTFLPQDQENTADTKIAQIINTQIKPDYTAILSETVSDTAIETAKESLIESFNGNIAVAEKTLFKLCEAKINHLSGNLIANKVDIENTICQIFTSKADRARFLNSVLLKKVKEEFLTEMTRKGFTGSPPQKMVPYTDIVPTDGSSPLTESQFLKDISRGTKVILNAGDEPRIVDNEEKQDVFSRIKAHTTEAKKHRAFLAQLQFPGDITDLNLIRFDDDTENTALKDLMNAYSINFSYKDNLSSIIIDLPGQEVRCSCIPRFETIGLLMDDRFFGHSPDDIVMNLGFRYEVSYALNSTAEEPIVTTVLNPLD